MEREYQAGTKNDVTIFTGIEIEHTPAYGKKTLFVVGIHKADELTAIAIKNNCDHIYIGANHSYTPTDYDEVIRWEGMIMDLLKKEFWITLDIDYNSYEWSEDMMVDLCCYDKFIPMISVKIPYITNLNYNTCVKIDDSDFKATNPGVWVHHLHDLMDRKKFTDWSKYGKDEIIK
jgi:hypothetical protein